VAHHDSGHTRFVDNGIEIDAAGTHTFTIVEGDPLSASIKCDRSVRIGRNDWRTRVETSSRMSADTESFYVTNILDAYEGNTRVFTKTWSFTVPRDLV